MSYRSDYQAWLSLTSVCLLLFLAGVSSYGQGLVGLWSWDSLISGTSLVSSNDSTAVVRGRVPCNLPDAAAASGRVCPAAFITGNGNASVPALGLGRFGSGLVIGPGISSWGQIYNAPLGINAPGSTGFTVAAWVKVTNNNNAAGGMVFERLFDNLNLNIWSSNVQCSINSAYASKAVASWSGDIRWTIGSAFHHYACTYGEISAGLCPVALQRLISFSALGQGGFQSLVVLHVDM